MTRTKKFLKFVIKIVDNDDEVMIDDTQTNFATLNNSSQSHSIITTKTARKASVFLKKVTKNARADNKRK
jgi:hypothetical protein